MTIKKLTHLKKLPRSFYAEDTRLVARSLLGKYLIYEKNDKKLIGRIVETEAYLGPHDLAAHSCKGRTKRTEIMFGAPGFAYVYMIYGMYFCMNVVTQEEGHGSAVLIRGLEPIENISGKTAGPGLLCHAMGITKKLNGHDLLSDNFYIAGSDHPEKIIIVKKPRIGVAYAKHWAKRHLRFYIKNNPFVSRL